MAEPVRRSRLRGSPLIQLILARLREFYREPSAIFWVYGFPILMVIALGVAFRSRPVERLGVDLVAGPQAQQLAARLQAGGRLRRQHLNLEVQVHTAERAAQRLRTARTDLVLEIHGRGSEPSFRFAYDEARAESRLARATVNEVLQEVHGRRDRARLLPDRQVSEPGSRYIDFLVPGLLGMGLMGGGLWGVGYVIVDMRRRQLLKRFLATPMRRSHFLAGIMVSRLLFMVPEILFLIAFAWLVFGVAVQGSLLLVGGLVLLGAFTFAGVGLLVASRARTMETASGLMNLVMLPMWILSGIFFSWERFPAKLHLFIRALPLTALNDALRAVMLEGAGPTGILVPLAILSAWGVGSFVLALRWFRWI